MQDLHEKPCRKGQIVENHADTVFRLRRWRLMSELLGLPQPGGIEGVAPQGAEVGIALVAGKDG